MHTSHNGPLSAALLGASMFLLAAPRAVAAETTEDAVEEIVVQATRSGRRVQDEPIRVEVIGREEIEEKILMTPGSIATIVAETGGVRVQVTAPGLGAASVRIQGLRGRYAQILADGLPLYGGQALGVLQIPPSDLGQVEVIKGAASALYGPAALGGVINLVSRRPADEPMVEAVLNATSRDGQDATAYGAAPLSPSWSASLMAGLHRQSRQDLDGDGWIDMAGYERWTLRPRLFWRGDGGTEAYLTVGAMGEDRVGGTEPGALAPDGLAFVQAQASRRIDAGLTASMPVNDLGTAHLRAAAVEQAHRHRYGAVIEKDRHSTLFAEASFAGGPQGASWLAGVAVQRDDYRNRALPAFDYAFTTPALFAQTEVDLGPDLTLAASARWDSHSEYGDFLSPRVSPLYRPGRWTLRASLGQGFYAPTPFIEEIEAAGLSRLQPLAGLKAETARTASLEGGFRDGPFEANLALFASTIDDAVRLEVLDPVAGPWRVRLANAPGSTRTQGAEALLRYRRGDLTLTGSYVRLTATEPDPSGPGRRAVPVTPRDMAGFVAIWERPDVGRLGFEAYYTGRQDLDDNPYRTRSRPYVELGLLAEKTVGEARVFINLENLLNVRQTRWDRLVLPRRGPAGEWTVDAWAPTDGLVANGGVRLRFGG